LREKKFQGGKEKRRAARSRRKTQDPKFLLKKKSNDMMTLESRVKKHGKKRERGETNPLFHFKVANQKYREGAPS